MGRVVYIHATAPNKGSFSIDLVSSVPEKYDLANIPMRITVNLVEKEVIITHKDKDKTNKDSVPVKRDAGPFEAGKEFQVMIFAQSSGYEIAVAGMHFAFFKYPTHTSIHNMSVQLVNVTVIQKIDYHCEDD